MNGLRNDLRERILVANPHLRVLTFGAGLRMDDWRKALADRPPAAGRGGRGAGGHQPGRNHRRAGLRRGRQPGGLRPGHRRPLGDLAAPGRSSKGDLSFRTTKPNVDGGILLGARLANRLSVYPGDIVTLVPVTQAKVNPAARRGRARGSGGSR